MLSNQKEQFCIRKHNMTIVKEVECTSFNTCISIMSILTCVLRAGYTVKGAYHSLVADLVDWSSDFVVPEPSI